MEIVTGTTTVRVGINSCGYTASHSKPSKITVTQCVSAGRLMSWHEFLPYAIVMTTGVGGCTTHPSEVCSAKVSTQSIRCGLFVDVLADFQAPKCANILLSVTGQKPLSGPPSLFGG